MPLFKWKEEYSVHNDDLDRHHQYFIAILNGLYDNCFEAKLDDVDKKIDELLETVGFYFSAEEEYMRECGYPGVENHIQEHLVFNRKILELQQTFRDNHLELTKELIIYLGKWLLTHMLKEDRYYALNTGSAMNQ
ncbi:bacteriohemerythrin [Geobacter sp. SVR]|uniref:bacteriohemerythrin n=1 Tax=Geobacter sp. SVR TaxID=2495594 RepID=UPI00143EF913|nr:bacteriohemerythrin [Geobacter sp. SVR]BCS52704.1 hypothetical protein GSVR_10120 [Geobacter sp. SVR]GCF86800.1 hemerythrin [Geobacter sp. SVR]